MDIENVLLSAQNIIDAAESIKSFAIQHKQTNDETMKNLLETIIEQRMYTIKLNMVDF